jgi:hypothetical protein
MTSIDDLLSEEQRQRRHEILAIAREGGYNPYSIQFWIASPDLARELADIDAAPRVANDPLAGIWDGIAALGAPGSGLGNIAQAARNAVQGGTAAARGASPIRGAAQAAVRPSVSGEVIPPGAARPVQGAQRALNPPHAAPGDVIPPPGSAAVPPSGPPRGPIIEGTATTPPPGPRPPAPGSPPAALPGGAAPTQGSGLLASAWNAIRQHPWLVAGAVGTGIAAGGVVGSSVFNPGYRLGDPTEPQMPGADIVAQMQREQEDEKRRQQAEEARARRIRGENAELTLTEAQAAYYQAQREKALQELANSDLTDSEKMEVAHQYALEAAREKAKLEMDQELVRQGGENERTGIREQGADRRAQYQGQVEMRGQDQRAREAQDRFVVDWMQNQIQRGQLSLDRATRLFQAYQNERKLPAEILKMVSDSVSPFLPYMTNRSAGESAPGFEAGGLMSRMARDAGIKFNPEDYKAHSNFDLMGTAAQYGGGPGQARSTPSADDIFRGAGDVPEVSPQGVRGMSASSGALPRPQFGAAGDVGPMLPERGPNPRSYSARMPDDMMERIASGLR